MGIDTATMMLNLVWVFQITILVTFCLWLGYIPHIPVSVLGWLGLSVMVLGLVGYFFNPMTGILSFLTDPITKPDYRILNVWIYYGMLIILCDFVRGCLQRIRRLRQERD